MRDLCHQYELFPGRGIWIRLLKSEFPACQNANFEVWSQVILTCKYPNYSLSLAWPAPQLLAFFGFGGSSMTEPEYSDYCTRKPYTPQRQLLMNPLNQYKYPGLLRDGSYLFCRDGNDWHCSGNRVIKILLSMFPRVPFKCLVWICEKRLSWGQFWA